MKRIAPATATATTPTTASPTATATAAAPQTTHTATHPQPQMHTHTATHPHAWQVGGPPSGHGPRRAWHAAIAAFLAALLSLAPMAGHASDHKDHDRARRALMSGEVLSLRQVLDLVAREYPGEPVEIEFEHDDGIYVYEIKLLQPSGSIVKMKVDAATGKVIKAKGRGIERRNHD